MASGPHRIRRLRLRASAATPAEAFALRTRLRATVEDALLPSLAVAFDELAPAGEVVHLPRIELLLHVEDAARIAEALPALVREAVAKQVRHALAAVPRSTAEAAVSPSVAVEAGTPARAVDAAMQQIAGAPTRAARDGKKPALRESGREGETVRERDEADPVAPHAAPPAPRAPTETSLTETGAVSPEQGTSAASVERAAPNSRARIDGASPAAPTDRQSPQAPADDEAPSGTNRPAEVARWSSAADFARALSHYLATGALPWHVTEDSLGAALAAAAPSVIARAAIASDPDPRTRAIAHFRLLQLLPETRWVDVATALAQSPGDLAGAITARAPTAGELRDAITALAAHTVVPRWRRLRIAASLLAAAEGDAVAWDIFDGSSTFAPAIEALLPTLAEALRPTLARLSRPAHPPDEPAPPVEGEAHPHSAPAAPDEPIPRADPDPTPRSPDPIPMPPQRPAVEPFGLAAPFAGLILLHPFLPSLFEATGIKRPRQPALDQAALPRAAALLHACAAADLEPAEHRLGFIKILLGLRPEAPLPVADGLLDERDRAEIEALLGAVITHWSALKRTSPAGLRDAFLRRGGLVRDEEHGVRLQVEPAGTDVLLARLPWGIATAKLPWMKKAILTEWPPP